MTEHVSSLLLAVLKLLVEMPLSENQLYAIKKLYDSCNGSSWNFDGEPEWNFSVNTSTDPCDDGWYGLTCQNSNIVRLDLSSNELRGQLPEELGLLSGLTYLDFSNNVLMGTIPTQLAQLSNLQHLLLEHCSLNGTLPSEIGQLTALTRLWVSINQLSGNLPSEIGSSKELQIVDMSMNSFSGTLPGEALASLSKLRVANLDRNLFTGTVSSLLGKMTALRWLSLTRNRLSGTIPTELGRMLQLSKLYLDFNCLQGSLPTELGHLQRLMELDLTKNLLTGTLPTELGKLNKLYWLVLSHNNLRGSLPSSLGLLSDLETLNFASNFLTGSLPSYLGLLSGLTTLSLADNSLSGSLPSELGCLEQLVYSFLSGNAFSGSVPTEFDTLQNLVHLSLANNSLSGPLRFLSSSSSFTSLRSFDLSNNKFTGSLPVATFALQTALAILDVSHNRLTGQLPPEISRLGQLKFLELSFNSFSGSLSSQWCALIFLEVLGLSNNRISGSPPHCLSSMSNLKSLLLSHNRLTGTLDFLIPVATTAEPGSSLQTIDVSGNSFNGLLPTAIFQSNSLQTFAAASNCLDGSLPTRAMCQATSLESLVLDGLSGGDSCRKTLFPPALERQFSLSGTTTQFKVQGSLPACLFSSLKNITTLHLSGNDLSGTFPTNLASWPAKLVDLCVSHNRLSGTIPAALQRGISQFQSFDVAFNRLTGDLTDVYLDKKLESATKMDFRVNRFSGTLSPSIIHSESIKVLEGSLIACDGKSQLPQHDPDLDRFRCGSDTFNAYMISYAVLTTVFLCALSFRRWRSGKLSLSFDTLSSSLSQCLSQSLALPHLVDTTVTASTSTSANTSTNTNTNTMSTSSNAVPNDAVRHLLESFRTTQRFALQLVAIFVVALLPVYGTASALQGTHTNLYAWAVSAGFKSGTISAAVFLVCWVAILLAVHENWDHRGGGGVAHFPATDATAATTTHSSPPRRKSRLIVVRALLLLRLLFITAIDVVVMMAPNVGYVLAVDFRDSSQQIAAGLALSVFKMVWGMFFLPRILASRQLMFGVSDLEVSELRLETWTGGFVFELAIRAFNSVVAPTIALLAADSSCFSLALFAPSPVDTTYETNTWVVALWRTTKIVR